MTLLHSEIETIEGNFIDVLNPDPAKIILMDIAISLSRLCRFNGHTRLDFSVSEHSIEVAKLMAKWYPGNEEAFLCGLMHDAAEAYISDIPRPIKKLFYQEVKRIENKLLAAVFEAFNLPYPCPWEDTLKKCDNQVLLWEAEVFLPSKGLGYNIEGSFGCMNPLFHYQETTEKAKLNAFLDQYYTKGKDFIETP